MFQFALLNSVFATVLRKQLKIVGSYNRRNLLIYSDIRKICSNLTDTLFVLLF